MLNLTMEEEWQSFSRSVLSCIRPEDIDMFKTVFMAGGWAMSLLMVTVSKISTDSKEGIKTLAALRQECEAHFDTIKGYRDAYPPLEESEELKRDTAD